MDGTTTNAAWRNRFSAPNAKRVLSKRFMVVWDGVDACDGHIHPVDPCNVRGTATNGPA